MIQSPLFAPTERLDAPPPGGMPARADALLALRDQRIVIVEDEGITQLQLRKLCKLVGLEVVGTAETAREGVEVVLRTRPDIVLMDIHMPGKESGLDAAEEILATYATCVVMLTAFSESIHQERARRIGAGG